ncbi:MAG: YtxH domain-containing protein [Bradymonadaceae bacterium]
MNVQKFLDELNESVTSSSERSLDRVLDRLGLEKQHGPGDVILPALGIFGAGVAVGSVLGVLFAPKRGDELRAEIRDQLEDIRRQSREEYEDLRAKSREALETAKRSVEKHDDETESDTERTPEASGEAAGQS